MKIKSHILIGLGLILIVPPAMAAAPSATYGQLDALHDHIAILKEQLQIAKLKAGIANAGKPATTQALPGSISPGLGIAENAPPSPGAVHRHRATLPRVVSIDGRGARLSAVLLMPDGGEVIATPGLGLPGGLTVHDVSATGVRVMKAGTLFPLPFAEARTAAESSPASARVVAGP